MATVSTIDAADLPGCPVDLDNLVASILVAVMPNESLSSFLRAGLDQRTRTAGNHAATWGNPAELGACLQQLVAQFTQQHDAAHLAQLRAARLGEAAGGVTASQLARLPGNRWASSSPHRAIGEATEATRAAEVAADPLVELLAAFAPATPSMVVCHFCKWLRLRDPATWPLDRISHLVAACPVLSRLANQPDKVAQLAAVVIEADSGQPGAETCQAFSYIKDGPAVLAAAVERYE
jgi:hypothetical protein